MRIIKFYAWEHAFLEKVTKLRIEEMKIVRFLLTTRSAVNAVAISIPVFATILAFVTYSLTGHNLQAATVFSSLTLFNLLRMPLMFLPLVFSSMTDAQVALSRIQDMLSAEEINDVQDKDAHGDLPSDVAISIKMADFFWEQEVKPDAMNSKSPQGLASKASKDPRFWQKWGHKKDLKTHTVSPTGEHKSETIDSEKNVEIAATHASKQSNSDAHSLHQTMSHASAPATHIPPEISHSTAAMEIQEEKQAEIERQGSDFEVDSAELETQKPFSINNLNLSIKRGELVAIVGAVGSGKSSILSALVGEMRKGQGAVQLSGTIGFCAQVPWIMNATVRDNILFGRPFDEEKYRRVVHAAALEPDFEIFPNGDDTEIGERGITISGGQKQRLNIARATYFDADIILLDDPLSAVDAHVGNHLFEKCIVGELGDRTRLLVTHQLHFLPQVHRILVVKDGVIVEQGTYQELVDHGQDFARILRDFGAKEEEKEEQAEEAIEEADPVAAQAPSKGPMNIKPAQNAEDRETGAVSMAVYKGYFKKGGGLWTIPLLLGVLVLAQVAQVG